jgi:hypothetical protein
MKTQICCNGVFLKFEVVIIVAFLNIFNSLFIFQMPRIWLDYCQFLMDQCRITRTRQVFDRALRALPITQHHRVWPLYLKFLKIHDIPETAVRVFRRYLKVSQLLIVNFEMAALKHMQFSPLCSSPMRTVCPY